MKNFNKKFKQLMEDMTCATTLGPGQAHATAQQSSDFYATGDTRTPKILGLTTKAKAFKAPNGKKKKQVTKIPMIRRTPPSM
jgi:hypothetical protein